MEKVYQTVIIFIIFSYTKIRKYGLTLFFSTLPVSFLKRCYKLFFFQRELLLTNIKSSTPTGKYGLLVEVFSLSEVSEIYIFVQDRNL